MSFHDDFFRRNRPSLATRVAAVAWFIFCTVLSLAFLGLIAWAVITLVQWVVTK